MSRNQQLGDLQLAIMRLVWERGEVTVSEVHEALTGHLTRLVRNEQRSRLSDLVRQLPDSQREVLRLRYVEGLGRAEVAEVLDLSESVVKSRLFEGLKRLREQASPLDAR